MDRTLLGNIIREAREARKLTLRALDAASGVSYSYIGAIENGRPNANVTLEMLETLLRPLDLDVAIRPVNEPPEIGRLVMLWTQLSDSNRRVLLSVIERHAAADTA